MTRRVWGGGVALPEGSVAASDPDEYRRQLVRAVGQAAESDLEAVRAAIADGRAKLRELEGAERQAVAKVNELRDVRGVPAQEVPRGARLMSDYMGPG